MPSWVMSTISFDAAGQLAVDEPVACFDLDGDDAAFADVFEVVEVRSSSRCRCAWRRRVQLVAPGVLVRSSGPGCGWSRRSFPRAQFEEVRDAAALARRGHLGNLEDALDVAAAVLREEHQVIVRRGGEEMLDEIVVVLLVAPSRAVMPMTPLPPRRCAR